MEGGGGGGGELEHLHVFDVYKPIWFKLDIVINYY